MPGSAYFGIIFVIKFLRRKYYRQKILDDLITYTLHTPTHLHPQHIVFHFQWPLLLFKKKKRFQFEQLTISCIRSIKRDTHISIKLCTNTNIDQLISMILTYLGKAWQYLNSLCSHLCDLGHNCILKSVRFYFLWYTFVTSDDTLVCFSLSCIKSLFTVWNILYMHNPGSHRFFIESNSASLTPIELCPTVEFVRCFPHFRHDLHPMKILLNTNNLKYHLTWI